MSPWNCTHAAIRFAASISSLPFLFFNILILANLVPCLSALGQETQESVWRNPLPITLQGLRLAYPTSTATEGTAVDLEEKFSEGAFTSPNNFLVDGSQIGILTKIASKDPLKQTSTKQFRIYITSFEDGDSKGQQTGWAKPELRPLATIKARTVTLICFVGGRLIFAVSSPTNEETNVGNDIRQPGLYVADDDGVRRIDFPTPFKAAEGLNGFVRYPANDQTASHYYQHLSASPQSPSWTNADLRVFVYVSPDSIFLTRNRITRDSRRMMEIVEVKLDSLEVGESKTIQTSQGKRLAKKTGHPLTISREDLAFMEYAGKKKARIIHCAHTGERSIVEFRRDGLWHFGAEKEFMYFLPKHFGMEQPMETFEFEKVRVNDNELSETIRVANKHFVPGRLSPMQTTDFWNKELGDFSTGKHGDYSYIPYQGHFYFVTKNDEQKERNNLIVKVNMDNPNEVKEIVVPWLLPDTQGLDVFRKSTRFSNVDIHIGPRYVYYYHKNWIVRADHLSETNTPSPR